MAIDNHFVKKKQISVFEDALKILPGSVHGKGKGR